MIREKEKHLKRRYITTYMITISVTILFYVATSHGIPKMINTTHISAVFYTTRTNNDQHI